MGIRKHTVQESVHPLVKAKTVSAYDNSSNATSDATTYDACRAILNTTGADIAGVTITLTDMSTITLTVLKGVVYPIAAVRTSNANIAFLY